MSNSISFNFCPVRDFARHDDPDHSPGFMDYTDDSCMLAGAKSESGFFKSVSGLSTETELVARSGAEPRQASSGLIAYNGHAGLGANLIG